MLSTSPLHGLAPSQPLFWVGTTIALIFVPIFTLFKHILVLLAIAFAVAVAVALPTLLILGTTPAAIAFGVSFCIASVLSIMNRDKILAKAK
jgi:hypothetical protein